MYIIAVYDMGEKRVVKMLKLCRRYLSRIQNSTFEGEISEAGLSALRAEANVIMEEQDSLIIFKVRQEKWLEKEIIGEERAETGTFL